ncbi:unnamed protein product [Phytophthora lilii]|uniref:Unnamed protein product n=1 Tax=Phytophthora lilii TaxID=2077276 RepID=A0A9W6U8N4_9STRA|nr:unnamed protein product [Phytophthora lilii]
MESVDAALRYLQRQFASVASDEAQWNAERQKLQAQVRELEDQRGEQEQAYKDAMLRVKMLEFALRQERGRYLASPAAVSSTGGAATKPRSESAEVSRGVMVSRSMERSKSARTIEQPSPAPSPAGSPKAYSIYRTDSRNKSAANTPKNSQGKGTEISRPRMMSRTASGREVEREMNRTPSGREVEREMSRSASGSGREVEREMNRTASGSGREVERVELRALAFHPTEPLLVSGSEDCTLKVWNLSSVASGPPSQRATEVDSLVTMRTHTQSVLALAVFSAENYPDCSPGRPGAFASAGRDGAIHLFRLPGSETDKPEPYTYEEYEDMKLHSIRDAHDDAIWDLHAHPLSNTLFSAGADGVVRMWGVTSANASGRATVRHEDQHEWIWYALLFRYSVLVLCRKNLPASTELGPNVHGSLIPTSVHSMLTDPKTCVVGYTNGAIAQFDYAAERVIQLTRAIDVDTKGRGGQVNKVRFVRFIHVLYEISNCSCMQQLVLFKSKVDCAPNYANCNCRSPRPENPDVRHASR